jgi:hypothetical protein
MPQLLGPKHKPAYACSNTTWCTGLQATALSSSYIRDTRPLASTWQRARRQVAQPCTNAVSQLAGCFAGGIVDQEYCQRATLSRDTANKPFMLLHAHAARHLATGLAWPHQG